MTKNLSRDVLVEELTKIKEASRSGRLRPEDVVAEASDPQHKLHRFFEWDDTRAAHQHRLQQARILICRCEIVNPQAQKPTHIPAFVSLVKERKGDDAGYRAIGEILSDEQLRQQLMDTAVAELEAWTKRYKTLTELVAPIKQVIKEAKNCHLSKK